jgi:hypothetical protein
VSIVQRFSQYAYVLIISLFFPRLFPRNFYQETPPLSSSKILIHQTQDRNGRDYWNSIVWFGEVTIFVAFPQLPLSSSKELSLEARLPTGAASLRSASLHCGQFDEAFVVVLGGDLMKLQ